MPDGEEFARVLGVVERRCHACMALVANHDTFDLRDIKIENEDEGEDDLMCFLMKNNRIEDFRFVLNFYSSELVLGDDDRKNHFLHKAVAEGRTEVVRMVLEKWSHGEMVNYYQKFSLAPKAEFVDASFAVSPV